MSTQERKPTTEPSIKSDRPGKEQEGPLSDKDLDKATGGGGLNPQPLPPSPPPELDRF